jgi:phage tail protein X
LEEAFALAKTALQNDMKSHITWHVYGLLSYLAHIQSLHSLRVTMFGVFAKNLVCCLDACEVKCEEAFALAKTALQNDMKSHITWHVYGLLLRQEKNYAKSRWIGCDSGSRRRANRYALMASS